MEKSFQNKGNKVMNLIEGMRSEFAKSKKWHNAGLFAGGILLIVSVLLISQTDEILLKVLSAGVLIIPVLIFIFKEESLVHQEYAENIRRSLMLWDGMGTEPSHLELAQVKIDLGIIDNSEPVFSGPYYDSKLAKGARRLADIITESVFFTKNLSGTVAKILLTIFLILFGLSIFCLYLLIFSDYAKESSVVMAKCIAVLMIYFLSGDIAYLWRRYSSLSNACRQIEKKSDELRRSELASTEAVMKIMDDYNCAVIQAPPLPGIIYQMNRNRLNEAWKSVELKEDK